MNFDDKKNENINQKFGAKENTEQSHKYWESFSKKVLKTSLQNPNVILKISLFLAWILLFII